MDLVMSRVSQVSHKNWGKECSLCSSRHGVPIECSARGCRAAHHTTCAIRAKLKMQAIFGKNYQGGIKLRSYCRDHAPPVTDTAASGQQDKLSLTGAHEIDMTNMADDRLQENSEELDYFWKYVDLSLVQKQVSKTPKRQSAVRSSSISPGSLDTNQDASGSETLNPTKSNKKIKLDFNSSNACSNPESPNRRKKSSVEHIDTATEQLMIDLIYRYWILLRTSNQGQSLIKFSPIALREREIEQRKNILRLRVELERIRNLTYMISKREKFKNAWLKTHHTIVKRTLGIVDEVMPTSDGMVDTSPNGKKHQPQKNAPLIDAEKLIDDLIGCDMIYPKNASSSPASPADCPSERRRSLSLVRRINQHLKAIQIQPDPYAKIYAKRETTTSPKKA